MLRMGPCARCPSICGAVFLLLARGKTQEDICMIANFKSFDNLNKVLEIILASTSYMYILKNCGCFFRLARPEWAEWLWITTSDFPLRNTNTNFTSKANGNARPWRAPKCKSWILEVSKSANLNLASLKHGCQALSPLLLERISSKWWLSMVHKEGAKW